MYKLRNLLYVPALFSLAFSPIQMAPTGAAQAGAASATLHVGMVIRDFSDEEYLEQVQISLSEEPERAEEIRELARQSRPHLTSQIDALKSIEIRSKKDPDFEQELRALYEDGEIPAPTVQITKNTSFAIGLKGLMFWTE